MCEGILIATDIGWQAHYRCAEVLLMAYLCSYRELKYYFLSFISGRLYHKSQNRLLRTSHGQNIIGRTCQNNCHGLNHSIFLADVCIGIDTIINF
jgi:hypothetical protein